MLRMPIMPYSTFIVGAIFLLVILEILLNMGIKMPWHDWIDANIPTWIAIINMIYLDISCIIAFTKIKDKFTVKQFNIFSIFFLISWLFVLMTLEKTPSLLVILSIVVLAFIIILWGDRKTEIEKVFKKWESPSNDDNKKENERGNSDHL